jgi:hypothetical protein
MLMPMLDAVVLLAGMYFLKEYWSRNMIVNYPPMFMLGAVPAYLLVWILSVFLSGGYEQPVRLPKIIRGIFSGTILILVVYALLPETYRFSRALILLGSVWACIAMVSLRLALNFMGWRRFFAGKRFAETPDNRRWKRRRLQGAFAVEIIGSTHNFIGFARPEGLPSGGAATEFEKYTVGSIDNLKEIIEVYSIDEVIFCARDITSNQIIRFHVARYARS